MIYKLLVDDELIYKFLAHNLTDITKRQIISKFAHDNGLGGVQGIVIK